MTDAPPNAAPAASPLKQALAAIDRLQARLRRAEEAACEPVAVVGIGCRLPGGVADPESYWRLLEEGRDAIGAVPASRWDADAFYDPDPDAPGRLNMREGGFLSQVDGFDAAFFGIPTDEAAAMDPQQRLALEVAWETLEDAGLPPSRLAGTRLGVYLGAAASDWRERAHADPAGLSAFSGTGASHSVIAGRIAYLLDFRGPAVTLDTACSSSLTAVHAAVRALRAGDCDAALAGGVSLLLGPEGLMASARMRLFSPSGRCRAFDASGDGVGLGEGCGMVLLKRLSEARRDGDRVRAVICGVALNHDGRSNGLTAPNGPAQADVIRRALDDGRVSAGSIVYVEAHGTGTPLGDPIEAGALKEVYGAGTSPCLIGAVKTNLGHLAAAAGIAGLIKAVLVLERGVVPPNLHTRALNPEIDLSGSRLTLASGVAPLPAGDGPPRAAVSSFGWSGTNAHVILERTGSEAASAPSATAPVVVPLSARDPAARDALLARMRRALAPGEPLAGSPAAAIAGAAALGREPMPVRAVGWGCDAAGIRATLTAEPAADMPASARRWLAGEAVDWAAEGLTRTVADLPRYPWTHRRFPGLRRADATLVPAASAGRGALRRALAELPGGERRAALVHHLQATLADMLGLSGPEAVPPEAGFLRLGLTSLGALALHRRIEADLDAAIPKTVAFEGFSVAGTAEQLAAGPLAELFAAERPARAGNVADDVSDDLEALLDRLDERMADGPR